MTIYDATKSGPVIALIGVNRQEVLGDHAYRFSRPAPFPNGMANTLPMFARGTPVAWIEGQWQPSQLAKPVIKKWSDTITVLQ